MPIGKLTKMLGLSADPNAGMASMQASIDLQRQAMEELKNARTSDYAKLEELARRAAEVSPEFAGILEAEELDVDDLLSVFNSPAFQELAQTEGDIAAEYDKIIQGGGLSQEQKAAFRQAQDDATARSQAEQKAIRQQEMLEGRSGSGIGYAQKIAAQQQEAQNKQRSAEALANMAERGRMTALQGKQSVVGQQAQRALQQSDAARNIQQFNALQRTGVNQANLARRQQLADQAAAQQRQMFGQLAGIEGQRTEEDFRKRGAAAQGMQNFGNAMAQQAGMQAQAAQARAAGNMALVSAAIGATGTAMSKNDGGIKRSYNDGGVASMSNNNKKAQELERSLMEAKAYKERGTKYVAGTPKGTFLDNLANPLPQTPSMQNFVQPVNQQTVIPETSPSPSIMGTYDIAQGPVRSEYQKPYSLVDGINEDLDKMGAPKLDSQRVEYVTAPDKAYTKEELEKATGGEKKKEPAKPQEEGSKKKGKGSEALRELGDALMKSSISNMTATKIPKALTADLRQKANIQNPLETLIRSERGYADGGVRRPEEVMADIQGLMQQEFAKGGIKYADGGISPELEQAAQMLRMQNQQPAPGAPMPGGQPPMPPAPMPQGGPQMPPMPPQGVAPMPPMAPAPMPPQGQMMADGGMAYEDGGEGTIIDSGMEMYAGDQLPDRINDGEMVLNVEQQDRLNDALMELKRLKSKERTDKMLHDGKAEVNPMQQEAMMAFVRGEIDVDELPSERVVKEPTIGEPSGNMAKLLGMVSRKKRRG